MSTATPPSNDPPAEEDPRAQAYQQSAVNSAIEDWHRGKGAFGGNQSLSRRLARAASRLWFDPESGERGYASNLFYRVEKGEHLTYVVHLADLQRLNVYAIQADLVAIVGKISAYGNASEDTMGDVKRLMADYANAIRDSDYMRDRTAEAHELDEDDPWTLTTKKVLHAELIRHSDLYARNCKRVQHHWGQIQPPDDLKRHIGGSCSLPLPDRTTRRGKQRTFDQKQEKEKLPRRAVVGLVGGAALFVPMIVMVLKRSSVTAVLSTIGVSIFLFTVALILIPYWRGVESPDYKDIFATIAAYAAVLVVGAGGIIAAPVS